MDVDQLEDAGDVGCGVDLDVRSAVAVGGGVADEGADRGGGQERHAAQVDAHGGRCGVGESTYRGGEDVEVGHLDLAIDMEGVRAAAEREALSLEPVRVAGDGQVEVVDAGAVAVAVPVVD